MSLSFSCQNNSTLQPFELDQEYNALAKKTKVKSDWFETLSPQLKAYYAPARGKTGEELFESLHNIIAMNNKMDSYVNTRAFLFSNVDNVLNRKKLSGILDAYSQVFIPGFGEFGEAYKEIGDENRDTVYEDTINAEHTWPQSFYGKSLPMVSDMHALQVVLSMPNVMRSDFPFGEVSKDITYTTSCGSKLSVVSLTGKKINYSSAKSILETKEKNNDITPVNPNDKYRGVFEPCDPQKGNTARNMLYFYLRYHDMYIRQGSYDAEIFWKSKVKMFINWSENVDVVDKRERLRSEIIYNKQGNRNPFVDIPNLGSIIGEAPFLNN